MQEDREKRAVPQVIGSKQYKRESHTHRHACDFAIASRIRTRAHPYVKSPSTPAPQKFGLAKRVMRWPKPCASARRKLQTPLLIHTTTNDEDVNVLEVENLIKALKAAGKHQFNRLDTRFAKESRAEAYRFLAIYLNPPDPIK
jgi:hypothetical protein